MASTENHLHPVVDDFPGCLIELPRVYVCISALAGIVNNALVLEAGIQLLHFLPWVLQLDSLSAHGICSQQSLVQIKEVCEVVLSIWYLPF